MNAKAAKTGDVVPFAGKEPDYEGCGPIVAEIDKLQDEIDDIMADARDSCSAQRERIKELRTEIHDKTGHALAAIAAGLSGRRQLQKTSRRLAKLSAQHRKQAQDLASNLPDAKVQYTLDI